VPENSIPLREIDVNLTDRLRQLLNRQAVVGAVVVEHAEQELVGNEIIEGRCRVVFVCICQRECVWCA